jgi:hypothetical protein
MVVLSGLAKIANDYRVAKAGVVLLTGAAALATSVAATAQEVATNNQIVWETPEQRCDDVRLLVDAAEFKPPYRSEIYRWMDGGCRGEVPKPSLAHRYNKNRFDVVVGASSAGRIALNP